MKFFRKLFVSILLLLCHTDQLKVHAEEAEKPALVSDGLEEEPEELDAFEAHEQMFDKKRRRLKEEPHYVFKSYGPYKKQFAEICELIADDQQLEWLTGKAAIYAKTVDDCLPCKTLYATLNSSCKVKKSKQIKAKPINKKEAAESEEDGQTEEEPTPEPTSTPLPVKKMDPGTELIDLVSRTFIKMAEVKPREKAEGYFAGVEHLVREMRDEQGKSETERRYYSTLSAYIEAPFRSAGFIKKDAARTDVPKERPTPSVSLDQLF